MGHQNRGFAERPCRFPNLLFKTKAQVRVQRREGLVQHKYIRPRHQNPCQRRPLLLTSGYLGRVMPCKLRQSEPLHDLFRSLPSSVTISLSAAAGKYILFHSHIWKQSVILKKHSHPPFLRGQIDFSLRIEQNPIIQPYDSLVRLFYPRDTFEGHALAASRGPKQRKYLVLCFKFCAKPEIAKALFNIHIN